mgnify:CR=1 FL=1
MSTLTAKRQQLLDYLRQLGSCAVAFSGGVDSAVVAAAAHQALGQNALAVTAVSPSLASGERELAAAVAARIGIRHVELQTAELSSARYVANQPDRCFFCKSELYGQVQTRLADWGVQHLVNGANADDLGDHRPGMRAANDFAVKSPLADLGISKSEIRELARQWDLQVADKPATPCLSSRIAYGEEVTVERLQRIDAAEAWLRGQGLSDTRVRYHRGDLARLEVHVDDIPRLMDEAMREAVTRELRRLGFKFVTLDLQGRRSGSLNDLVPIEQLERGV